MVNRTREADGGGGLGYEMKKGEISMRFQEKEALAALGEIMSVQMKKRQTTYFLAGVCAMWLRWDAMV